MRVYGDRGEVNNSGHICLTRKRCDEKVGFCVTDFLRHFLAISSDFEQSNNVPESRPFH